MKTGGGSARRWTSGLRHTGKARPCSIEHVMEALANGPSSEPPWTIWSDRSSLVIQPGVPTKIGNGQHRVFRSPKRLYLTGSTSNPLFWER